MVSKIAKKEVAKMNVLIAALVMFAGSYKMPVKKMVTSPVLQQRLNLTDEQISKIRDVWFKTEPKLIDLRAQKAKIMLNIREELNKDAVDFDKLSKLYSELGGIDAKIKLARAKMLVSVKGILTKDQIKKLRLMKYQWRRHQRRMMRHMRQFRPMRPMTPPMNPPMWPQMDPMMGR